MNTLQELLDNRRIVIADGAWGTQLSQRGLEPGEAPESWVLERSEAVRGVARGIL